MSDLDSLAAQIQKLSPEDQARVRLLLSELSPHPMELRLKASANTILEALARSKPLTIRGIEGILAEASFANEVLPRYPGLTSYDVTEEACDFLISENPTLPKVRIQVKMQRRKNHKPMTADQVLKNSHRRWPATSFVVEVQRTRGGKSKKGDNTRPYSFASFDVLAVSLGASAGSWSQFVYTVAAWLIPDPDNKGNILKYQPVSASVGDDWTDSLTEVIERFRANVNRTIAG